MGVGATPCNTTVDELHLTLPSGARYAIWASHFALYTLETDKKCRPLQQQQTSAPPSLRTVSLDQTPDPKTV